MHESRDVFWNQFQTLTSKGREQSSRVWLSRLTHGIGRVSSRGGRLA